MAKVVIIDDHEEFLRMIGRFVENLGHQSLPYSTGKSGIEGIEEHEPELLIVDLRIEDMNGLQIIEKVSKKYPAMAIVMVTGFGTIETAVKAMKLGAFDYLTKPFEFEDLERTIARGLEINARKSGIATSSESSGDGFLKSLSVSSAERVGKESYLSKFVGQSQGILDIMKTVGKIADETGNILIQGEIGSGKQTLARAIHNGSNRSGAPFKILPCSSLSEDLLERELFGDQTHPSIFKRAQGGSVLIDEIDLLPLRLQSHLDAFLEEIHELRVKGSLPSEQDFRFISTSNVHLDEVVGKGAFREDLYYRIAIIPFDMPPLRHRREDIIPLTEHFIENYAKISNRPQKYIDKFAAQLLTKYAWPGNVDELQNAIFRASILAEDERIRPSHLPEKVTQKIEVESDEQSGVKYEMPIGSTLADFTRKQEKSFIRETLRYNEGNREKTASMLGVSIATLYRKMDLKVDSEMANY